MSNPIDPLVCPRGHHSIDLNATRFSCRTCRNQGRGQTSWDRSELVNLREQEPPLRDGREIRADGGNASSVTVQSSASPPEADSVSSSSIRMKSVDPQSQLSLPIGWISPVGHWRAAYTEPHSVHSANPRFTSSLFDIPIHLRGITLRINFPIQSISCQCTLHTATDQPSSQSKNSTRTEGGDADR